MPESLLQFTDLNNDCLKHVFDRLDLISLSQMCEVDSRFEDIIMGHVIPLRTINFSEFSKNYSVRKIFKLFGKSMTRLIVRSEDIQMVFPGYSRLAEFLRILVEFGKPGKLKEVQIMCGGNQCHVPAKLLHDAAPYFSNVHKLQFDLKGQSDVLYWMHNVNSPDSFAAFINAIDKTR